MDRPHLLVEDMNVCFVFTYFVLVAQNFDEGGRGVWIFLTGSILEHQIPSISQTVHVLHTSSLHYYTILSLHYTLLLYSSANFIKFMTFINVLI